MQPRKLAVAVSVALSLISTSALSQDHGGHGHLGSVKFATSCDPKVQPHFDSAVAMLHSFYYSAAEKAFRDVLAQDPSCTIATWGIASILMSNPLAGQGAAPKRAEVAQAAIEQGRRTPPKTERERDYIAAVAEYYRDFSSAPNARVRIALQGL